MLHDALDIILDLRCLQDPAYKDRGVGRLSANLVKSAREFIKASVQPKLIGLVDPNLPKLEKRFEDLVDVIRTTAYTGAMGRRTCFIELSPMTHDPLFVAPLNTSSRVFTSAVVYDFIPTLEPEQYLPLTHHKIAYQTSLLWLSQYDHFFPISKYTADELARLLGVSSDRITQTAAPIDPAFTRGSQEVLCAASQKHVLAVAGADRRKNIECAVEAHARSRNAQQRGIPLIVVGNYPEPWQAELRSLYEVSGGDPRLLRFPSYLPEHDLVALYRSAQCVIVPSRAEGFSMPVVEAMASGAPVFASAIPAHRELVGNDICLFNAEDYASLTALIDRVVTEPDFYAAIVECQRNSWQAFQAEEVAQRFWSAFNAQLGTYADLPSPMYLQNRRPKIAFLSPMPPDRSGVADYTATSLREIGKLTDVDVFTPTRNAPRCDGVQSILPLSAFAQLSSDYDRVVGVIGNSHFHLDIFHLLMRYGGACIEHDNRLLGFYRVLLGEERARTAAEQELQRNLEPNELERWLSDESTLEATFLGELAKTAEPILFHSKKTASIVRSRFGIEPGYLPFSIYREWNSLELSGGERERARSRLGVAPDEILIVTFGYVQSAKAPEDCIWALEILCHLGFQAKLHFVGESGSSRAELTQLCTNLGVADHVRFIEHYVGESTYRDYLLAADIAIQLRTHLLGGLSGALLDCIAAGIPSVANEDLAQAMDAPGFVARIPDRPSPILLAGAVANLVEQYYGRPRPEKQRLAYYDTHNFGSYARQFCQALHLDVCVPSTIG